MTLTSSQRQLAAGVIPCGVVSALAVFVVPWFQRLYATQGLSGVWLPLPTRVMVATYPWWGITVLITVAAWWLRPRAANRGSVAVGLGSVCWIFLLLFGFVGCFAPLSVIAGGGR